MEQLLKKIHSHFDGIVKNIRVFPLPEETSNIKINSKTKRYEGTKGKHKISLTLESGDNSCFPTLEQPIYVEITHFAPVTSGNDEYLFSARYTSPNHFSVDKFEFGEVYCRGINEVIIQMYQLFALFDIEYAKTNSSFYQSAFANNEDTKDIYNLLFKEPENSKKAKSPSKKVSKWTKKNVLRLYT